nr:MAG: hypothetical protein [Apis mellifera filamentous virus]
MVYTVRNWSVLKTCVSMERCFARNRRNCLLNSRKVEPVNPHMRRTCSSMMTLKQLRMLRSSRNRFSNTLMLHSAQNSAKLSLRLVVRSSTWRVCNNCISTSNIFCMETKLVDASNARFIVRTG